MATRLRVVEGRPPERVSKEVEDSYLLESKPEYDPSRFVTAASDSKGHSKIRSISFPNDVWARMQEMVATNHWPYRNASDMCRDAVYHRMEQLAELDPTKVTPDVQALLQRQIILSEIAVSAELRELSEEFVDGVMREVTSLVEHGEIVAAASRVESLVEQMPDLRMTKVQRTRLEEFIAGFGK